KSRFSSTGTIGFTASRATNGSGRCFPACSVRRDRVRGIEKLRTLRSLRGVGLRIRPACGYRSLPPAASYRIVTAQSPITRLEIPAGREKRVAIVARDVMRYSDIGGRLARYKTPL